MQAMNDTPSTPKRPRKRLRLTLGVMMLLIAALAGWLASIAQRANEQRLAVARLMLSPGAVLRYDWQSANPRKSPDKTPRGPRWLRHLIGADAFDSVVFVSLPAFGRDPALLKDVGLLRTVESLNLVGSGKPIDEGLIAQIRPLMNLRFFSVHEIPNAQAFLPFCADKTRLTQLMFQQGISGGGDATDDDLGHLARLTELEAFRINGGGVTDIGFARFADLKKLRVLEVTNARITSLEPLRNLRSLAFLSLGERGQSRADLALTSVEPLRDMPELVTLKLGQNPVDDAGFREIGVLPKLNTLEAWGSRFATRALVTLTRQPALKNVSIGGPDINDGRLKILADSPSLEALTLHNVGVSDLRLAHPLWDKLYLVSILNAPLQDDGLAALTDLPKLTTLILDHCSMTDAGFAKVDRLPMLKVLFLENMPLGDSSLSGIARFPGLYSVSWRGTNLTDAGVAQFISLPNLRSLGLSETQITDAAIPSLLRLPRLQMLDLYDTKITEQGEAELIKGRSGLRILKRKSRDVF